MMQRAPTRRTRFIISSIGGNANFALLHTLMTIIFHFSPIVDRCKRTKMDITVY